MFLSIGSNSTSLFSVWKEKIDPVTQALWCWAVPYKLVKMIFNSYQLSIRSLSLLPKVKVKVALGGFSTLRPFGLLYSYPQRVLEFISRGATQHTDARDLYQRRRELLPMNFASKSVIHGRTSFFYMPQSWDMGHILSDARKIQRLRLGLNPRTRVPVVSMLTARPPKPSWLIINLLYVIETHRDDKCEIYNSSS